MGCNRRWLLLGAVLLLLSGCSAGSTPQTFRIGYMICNSLSETRARFDPLTAYLSRETGARFEAVYLDTYDVEEVFAAGELDFAHTNSVLYVILRQRHRAELVAAEMRGAYGVQTRGVIIARKDSGLGSPSDLRGRRLIFGPQWAPFGFLAQYNALLEAGIDPEADLGLYAFPKGTWKHEKVIYAVLYGAYDAGAAPLIDLEEMTAEGKVGAEDFTVLARSALAPYCTVSVHPRVSAGWRERTAQALIELGPSTVAAVNGETVHVLERGRITGFAPVSDAEYDPVRDWARAAKMPPYEEY